MVKSCENLGDDDRVFVSYSRAARMLDYSVDTIERRVKAGYLTKYDDNGTRRLLRSEVLGLLQAEKHHPQGFAHVIDEDDAA